MKLICGAFVHSLSLEKLEVIENGVMIVNDDGKILEFKKWIDNNDDLIEELHNQYEIDETIFLNSHQFMIPGFIDSHFHAPQIVNLGRGYDLPLLDWLNKYTFPRESEFKNIEHARHVYSKLIRRLLKHGTTTVSYFATIHLEATKILADCMSKYGQRGYVGKVCMDRNAPEYYIETHDDCIRDNIELIKYLNLSTLVTPCITPRFAVTCTPQLLQSLGDLAGTYDLPIQSHLSENKTEIETVKRLFPGLNYTQVYDEHKLLNNKTIMAHCIHLTNEEIDLIKRRNAGVSHCPASNINLMSGMLDVRKLLDKGIKVGLGSDVSGGNSCSILRAIHDAINVSKIVNKTGISIQEAFFLATLGNAQVLGLDKTIGNFEINKYFDALLIDTNIDENSSSMYVHHTNDELLDIFEKFIFSGDDRNIQRVYVNGNIVHQNE